MEPVLSLEKYQDRDISYGCVRKKSCSHSVNVMQNRKESKNATTEGCLDSYDLRRKCFGNNAVNMFRKSSVLTFSMLSLKLSLKQIELFAYQV